MCFTQTTFKMVIEIKKGMSKSDMKQALAKLEVGKKLDAKQFVATVKWPEDHLEYQKRLRNEW